MKKLILGAAALLSFAVVSCDKCADNSCSTPANDSLSMAYGRYAGTSLAMEFQRMGDLDKKEFLRGMQVVFGADDDKSTLYGMQVAMQMAGEMRQLDEQGIKSNRAAIVNAFKTAFLKDSVSDDDVMKLGMEFREQMNQAFEQAQAAKMAATKEAAESAPEAIENDEAAQKYIANLKLNDNTVKTTDSGLTYKVELPGEGATPGENATVVVNYTGRHLNGDVFDSTDGRGPATFNLQGVVPGFREGLMQIAKGGKATLYIPGKLGYGPEGQPAAGIGPNEMLVFDVELLDIQ